MDKEPILPRPVVLSQALLHKWLGDKGVERFRGAHHVQSGRVLMLEAIEDAIRERYPDGNYPPVDELMDPDSDPRSLSRRTKGGIVIRDVTGQGKPSSTTFGKGEI